jgi:hypothetical protein
MSHFDECEHGNPDEDTVTPDVVISFLSIHIEAQIDDLFESPRFLAMDKSDQLDALAIGAVLGGMQSIFSRASNMTERKQRMISFFQSAAEAAADIIEDDADQQEMRH